MPHLDSSNQSKPAKPYPEFPLYAHSVGQWAKKIRGKTYYFGLWADPDGAMANYTSRREELESGIRPAPAKRELDVSTICNMFLARKKASASSGELANRTWVEYKSACDFVAEVFGKSRLVADLRSDDFSKARDAISAKTGPHRLAKMIQMIRCIFKFGVDSGLIQPVNYGPGFKRPSARTMRLHRAARGEKLFTADEIISMLDAASIQMKAMILLGINCGFGNSDCGNLPISAINFDSGFVDYPRPKTGVKRRCHLWPETILALQKVIEQRKEPASESDSGILFVTKRGQRWAKDVADSPITKELKKITNKLGITGTFYNLRHTFRTIADEAKDQPAADYIMGHESTHMSSHYRERISDERLKAVSEYVRRWLYASPDSQ